MIEKNQNALPPYSVVEPLGHGLSVVQPERGKGYRFGKDSIALACFAAEHMRQKFRVLELCSGCGVIAMTLAFLSGVSVLGAEKDAELYAMSVCGAGMNGMTNVGFVNSDVRSFDCAENAARYGKFDAVVCNPPFYKADSRPASVAPEANSELTIEFCDVCRVAAAYLNDGGKFFAVHTSSRLDEVAETCRKYGLIPKELVLDKSGKTFLLYCVKGGRSGLTVKIKEFECYTS